VSSDVRNRLKFGNIIRKDLLRTKVDIENLIIGAL